MNNTKLKKIIFIGGNRYGEDGPMLTFIEECKKKNIIVNLITDSEHLSYPTKSMGTFKNALMKLKIKFNVKEEIDYKLIRQYVNSNSIIISVNSRIIFKKELIEKVSNIFYNYHNASIPEQKGAACHSWRLMQGITICHLTFHRIIEQIDAGDVIIEKKINFPIDANNLEKSYAFMQVHEKSFFNNFIFLLCGNNITSSCIERPKNEYYWPRINTQIHGWIDWNWHISDIIRFCNAFDTPFKGAGTFIDNIEVRISQVSIQEEATRFHPFQYGLIYRKNMEQLWIACNGGGLIVSKITPSTLNIFKLGKRFITPQSKLDNAKAGHE